jgi:hypothetical protein
MNNYIELKVSCEAVDHFPLPEGLHLPIKAQQKDIPVLITRCNIQFYHKGGMFALDRRLATKLLELLTPEPRHIRLAFTSLFIHHQKIGGIIMDFTLSKDTPSVKLQVQALDANGNILPAIDTVTNHPTLQTGSLKITGDDNIVITPDANDPTLITVSRANNTTNATSSLQATALSDDGETVVGSSVITVVADPVVDTGLARSLQFVAAPVTPSGSTTSQSAASGS